MTFTDLPQWTMNRPVHNYMYKLCIFSTYLLGFRIHWFTLSSSMQHLLGILYHETQIRQVGKVQRTAARWTCRKWRNKSSISNMLDEFWIHK